MSRFAKYVDDIWGYSGLTDAVAFSVSKNIEVAGFGIYLPKNGKIEGEAKFIEGDNASNKTIFVKTVSLTKDDGNGSSIYQFMFEKPVTVLAGKKYSCFVQLRGDNSLRGEGGSTNVTGEKDVIFTFSKFTADSTNGTSETRGQIPQIYYFV